MTVELRETAVATVVRPLLAADRPEWRRMRQVLHPTLGLEAQALEMEAIPADHVLVAERPGGGLAGFLELALRERAEGCSSRPVAFVQSWWVDADRRGHEVGRALMQAAEAWARVRGLKEIAAEVDAADVAGLAAHRAHGFSEVRRLVTLRKDV